MVHVQRSVGLNLDSKCNARCAHCCVSSSPNATLSLDDEAVDRILDDLLRHDEVREIGLTGGEPLLRRERTLSIIRRIAGSGRVVSCVSNGFWGVTPKAARTMFSRLEHAGLSDLTISYDDFHAPHVSVARIRNVLDASRLSRVRVILNMCVTRTHTSNALIEQLGESVLGIQITKFPAMPAGEGRKLPDSEFQRRPLGEHDLHCPGLEVIYHHDGRIYPCCSPPIFDTKMTLGIAGTEPYALTVAKIERNALFGIIQREGFEWFLDALQEVAPESPAATVREVVSACELCGIIFKDEASLEKLRPRILEYHRQRQLRNAG